MLRQLIILSSFTLFIYPSFAQQKIDWSKYDGAAFKEDTTLGFRFSAYYEKNYNSPFLDITASDAIFELRVFPAKVISEDQSIKIFQFYEDSTILTEYYLVVDPEVENFIKKYRDSASEVYTRGITSLLGKTDGRIWRSVKKSIPFNEAKEMMVELIRMNLFTIDTADEVEAIEKRIKNDPEYSTVLETHRLNRRGPINYRFSVFLEIKYKDKYRVFRTGGVFYYYEIENRMQKDIGGFTIGAELLKYLRSKTISN